MNQHCSNDQICQEQDQTKIKSKSVQRQDSAFSLTTVMIWCKHVGVIIDSVLDGLLYLD